MLPPTLTTLRRQHPSTGVVIVAARLDPMLMLEAMRAGVSEWVAEPRHRRRSHRCRGARELYAGDGRTGTGLCVRRRKGRRGTTTLAVNVAAALARASEERTLLIDLHLAYGDAAVFLGAEPRFSVVDALDNTHRLDQAFFESLVRADQE